MKKFFIIAVLILTLFGCASQKPLWEAIQTNEKKIAQIENRLDKIKKEIASIKRLIQQSKKESQARSSANEDSIKLLQEDIQNLNALIESLKIENFGQLEEKLIRIDKAVHELRERVSRLENETD